MDFADEKAREAQSEIMKMEVGSIVVHVHMPLQCGSLWLLVGPHRLRFAACTALGGAAAVVAVTHCTWSGTLCSKSVKFTFTVGLAEQAALSTCFWPWIKLPSLPLLSSRPAALAIPLAASAFPLLQEVIAAPQYIRIAVNTIAGPHCVASLVRQAGTCLGALQGIAAAAHLPKMRPSVSQKDVAERQLLQ